MEAVFQTSFADQFSPYWQGLMMTNLTFDEFIYIYIGVSVVTVACFSLTKGLSYAASKGIVKEIQFRLADKILKSSDQVNNDYLIYDDESL